MLDPQTAASLTGFLVSVVGVFKFLIKQGPNQNNCVRMMSALLGATVFTVYGLTHATDTSTAAMLQNGVDLAGEGFAAGAFGAAGVKGYHMLTDLASSVSVGKKDAPAAK